MSLIMLTRSCETASPVPRTYTGLCFRSLARSAVVSTIAPPASVTRQHISRVKGQQIMRASITSWIVMGSFILAMGCIIAHFRVAPGHLRQLLPRRAVLVHVPGHGYRESSSRARRPRTGLRTGHCGSRFHLRNRAGPCVTGRFRRG